ncbi:UNVERIFIED_CONTAM: hypothetical protein NCL1_35161 [Trichonephila clavipes]
MFFAHHLTGVRSRPQPGVAVPGGGVPVQGGHLLPSNAPAESPGRRPGQTTQGGGHAGHRGRRKRRLHDQE